jgi:hypothetical protein
MASPERFKDIAAVKRERERLVAIRDARSAALQEHERRLREPELQKALAGSMVKGIAGHLFSWNNAKAMVGGLSPEVIGGIAGSLVGLRAKSTVGKLLAMGLSAAVPMIANRLGSGSGGQSVLSELDRSWDRVKAYVKERRAARRERSS